MQPLVPVAFVGPDLEKAWNLLAKPGIYYINRTVAIGRFLANFGALGVVLVVANDKALAIQELAGKREDVKIWSLREFLLAGTLFDQSVGGVSSSLKAL